MLVDGVFYIFPCLYCLAIKFLHMSKYFTSGERRGVIALIAVFILITGVVAWHSRRPGSSVASESVADAALVDSIASKMTPPGADTAADGKTKPDKRTDSKKKKSRTAKPYPKPRDPLSEPVIGD